MKKTFFIFVFSLTALFSLASLLAAFDNNANFRNPDNREGGQRDYIPENATNPINGGGYFGGHDTITSEGMLLKQRVHNNDIDGGRKFNLWATEESLPSLRIGAHDEDTNKWLNWYINDPPIGENGWGNFFQHFYNPDTGKGLKGICNSSIQRAKDYTKEIEKLFCQMNIAPITEAEKGKLYDYFGRITHLLQDMAVPSHTKDDIHVYTKPFENYVNDHWNEIVSLNAFKEGVTVEKYLSKNCADSAPGVYQLMDDLANSSHKYPNEEELYDKFTDENGKTIRVLNQERLMKNVEALIPEAVQNTGCYINKVYKLMTETPTDQADCERSVLEFYYAPGGDNPDDRFDVSDEFYWEKEFGLSEADLIGLYLRTAIKKGKIGVWYKKQFMEIFIEGRTKYKDAPQENKDEIEAEFQAVGQKLEERRNQAENDWKGAPDVALFAYGFYNPSISLMLRFKEPVAFIGLDFDPLIVKDYPVMLVPSGGLFGLENSKLLQAKLNEYVKNGGTLIVFAQQHGYEFSVLPVPQESDGIFKQISGYGWAEDQSCFNRAVYIDTNHQIFSGQSRFNPSLNVDGYFTNFPSNATVLLRRTANGQPAMIMYDYGLGKVIVTSMYSDFAQGHSQASTEEIALVRDMIFWAKNPATLQEIKPGEKVSVMVTVANHTTVDAPSVKLLIYEPDRKNLLSEQTIMTPIPAGQSITIPLSYTPAYTSALGIYHIDYELYDEQGNIIQPTAETDSGRFALSKPSANPYKSPDFNFSIQSDAEHYIYGSLARFTVIAWNNTDTHHTITLKYYLPRLGPDGTYTLEVPAKSSESFNIVVPEVKDHGWLQGVFYDESMKLIGSARKGIWMVYLSPTIIVQTDRTVYGRGDTVNLALKLQNTQDFSYATNVRVKVIDPSNNTFYSTDLDISIPADSTIIRNLSFILSQTAQDGFYTVSAEVYDANGRKIADHSTNFDIPKPILSVVPALPSDLSENNNISFSIENRGLVPVSVATLLISLRDPRGTEVWNDQKQILSFQPGDSTTIDFSIPITNLIFGDYKLTYSLSYEGQIRSGETIIPNTADVSFTFDRPSYRIREVANLTVEITNTGNFNQESMSLTVSVPDANYNDTKGVPLLVTENSQQLTYSIPIPGDVAAGQHIINVTLSLPSGSSYTKTTSFSVPRSSLTIVHSDPEKIKIGDTINIDITNAGGIDTSFVCTLNLISGDLTISQNTIDDTIQAGEAKTCNLQIPAQATFGRYVLYANVLDTKTDKTSYLSKVLTVSGLRSDLSVRTAKDIYLSTEDITVLTQITNQEYAIDGANLNLKIVDKCSEPVFVESYHISTWDGNNWVERGILHYPEDFGTQSFDLSAFLPDADGNYKLRITHIGFGYANVDYISLIADGASYIPTAARELYRNGDILSYIIEADGFAANVRANTIEIQWQGMPSTTTKILSMRAKEMALDTSCGERIYWQRDIPITQATNTTVTLNQTVSSFDVSGQFYIQGTLRSSTGQVISQAEYPFTIIDGDIAIRFHVDKSIYRTGEDVRVIGEVLNIAQIEASGITLEIADDNEQTIYTENFTIPQNSIHAFTFTFPGGPEGVHKLSGKIYQNGSFLASITDKYEVVTPVLTVSVDAPQVAGHTPFSLNINVTNTGKVSATVQMIIIGGSLSDTHTITLLPNETKLQQYVQSIDSNATYVIEITGDMNQTFTVPVQYGEGADIVLISRPSYPEGNLGISVEVNNTGQIEEVLELNFQLSKNSLIVSQQSRKYYIGAGAKTVDTLYFDLAEGEYQLTANCQQPAVSTQTNFLVMKKDKVEMSISVEVQTTELIPVIVNLTNLGYNEINGNVQLSVVNSQSTAVWEGVQVLAQLLPQNSQLLTFNINLSAIKPGNYVLKTETINNSGQQLGVHSLPLIVYGPIFQVTQLPPYQTFTAGGEATFTFKVKNIGNQEGNFDFHFRAYDLIDSTKNEWLMPDEEKEITFKFILPVDLEEKDYFGEYELQVAGAQGVEVSRGQAKYHLTGINLNVSATLDKQNYSEGDTAHLSIVVSLEPGAGSLNLFARANYNGYEDQKSFTLDGTNTLTFDIPLTEITGEKLFYGIYHESGRSIHLNSLYIYKVGDILTIMTDKQGYNSGETVSTTISSTSEASGTLTLSAPNYKETFAFSGTATKSFVLPSTMTAGTYFINVQLSTLDSELINVTYPFDVAGISVKVKEATLDKVKYTTSDTLNLGLTIESNQNMSAILKTWIVDPEGKFVSTGERDISLSSSDNLLITHNSLLVTAVSGIHRLVYGIYTGDLLLVSGSEAFDVGDAVLTGISTNKTDYPTNTESVNVTVSMYGTVDAILELQLDGNTIKTQMVSLHGFSTLNIEVGIVEPGTHILKTILTAGGLKNIKETTFTYTLRLLDSDRDGMPDEWEIAHGLDPNIPTDANLDPDNDELTNLYEYQNGTNPHNPDTDNDGMPDGWEVTYGLNPDMNDASADKDKDGFSNLQEYLEGSNPADSASIPNQPPIAKAGLDQNVITGKLVALNGSESYDPEGALITFLWTFTEIPTSSSVSDTSLSDVTSAMPTFPPDVNGTYRLELIVNDGALDSASDEVIINASTPNVAPNANAGSDQNVFTGQTVYLDGSKSNDPDDGPMPLTYLWSFDSIPDGSFLIKDYITNRNKVSASFIPDVDGTYIISLNVNDGELLSLDTVHIMATNPNVPPNANAGADITLYLGETATLDGSASNDPDNGPQPLSYRWSFVTVPAGSQLNNDDISGEDTIFPFITPDIAGTYALELMVSDGLDVAFDNVAVTVIKKATLCSILGNDPKPSILDQDIFKFNGVKGESVTIRLNDELPEAGSGKRASLMLTAKIPGVLFIKTDRGVLPNEITATLPATGEYLITVAEQPKIAKGERYRGAYCISLEASQETMQTLKPAFWVE
jgi:hypothetical protein